MKFFKKIIIGLFLILATSAALYKFYPTKEVKAYSAGNWGLVEIESKLFNNVFVAHLDKTPNVWKYTVNGRPAFCADPDKTTNNAVYLPRGSVSNIKNNGTIARKAVKWYTNNGSYANTYYALTQVIVWLAVENEISDLTSAKTYTYVNTAMRSIYPSWDSMDFGVDIVDNALDGMDAIGNVDDVYYFDNGATDYQPVITMSPGIYYPAPVTGTVTKEATVNYDVTINIKKTDKITGKPLDGVVFDIYRGDTKYYANATTDVNGSVSRHYTKTETVKGTATYCTNLNDILPSEKYKYVSEAAAASAAQTAANNKKKEAESKTYNWKIVEKSTKIGYYLDPNTGTVSKSSANGTVTFEVKNQYQTGKITILKKDESTSAPLSGVVYGLYANEDIVHPDGKTGVKFKKDELVKEFPATNSEGKATLSGLYLGKYYIQEITPPDGYKLDKTKHEMELASTNSSVAVVEKSIELMDGVSSVTIYKIGADTKKALEKVKFELYAKEAILKTDKSVAFEKDQLVEAFPETDKEGKSTIYQLLPGQYYIKEISTLDGYVKLTKNIEFKLDELGAITVDKKYLDEEKYGDAIVIKNELTKISISKQDAATSKELPGATISICQSYLDEKGNTQIKVDENTGDCIEAILKDGTKATWVSTNKPHEVKGLIPGTYYLVEKIAPKDYATAESIQFTLSESGELFDKAGNSLKNNKLVMKDVPLVNHNTGSTSTYVVIGIIVAVALLGVGSYYYMKKTNK